MMSASGIAKDSNLGFLFVLIVGLLAGTISGIVGTGSSIMLMPVSYTHLTLPTIYSV